MPANLQKPTYGIGEWYGQPFVDLDAGQRHALAEQAMRHCEQSDSTPDAQCVEPICPFARQPGAKCTKKGGVCSIRLYEKDDRGVVRPAPWAAGSLITTCPTRYQQRDTVYREIGKHLLNDDAPTVLGEVPFLKKLGSESADEGVGKIDNVLVSDIGSDLAWCAVEVQAVYFSGKKMQLLFDHIRTFEGDALPFPDRRRAPDWRSSGAKRLLPQLQTKGPTLRRWGKKRAVVVDTLWYDNNIGSAPTTDDLSNCDIVWFVFGFDHTTGGYQLKLDSIHMQELEATGPALVGGTPVTRTEFENKLRESMHRP